MFGPEADYERTGDVRDVVFPCGQTIGTDGDTIHLYYGAADSCMALATGSIRALLAWLDTHSSADDESGGSTDPKGISNGYRRSDLA